MNPSVSDLLRGPAHCLARPARWGLVCAVSALLLACASPAIQDAEELAQSGQHEAALKRLDEGLRDKPTDRNLRAAYFKQRDTTVAHLMFQAESARAAGRMDLVRQVLKRMEAVAPQHPRAIWLRDEVDRLERHQRLIAEARQSIDQKAYDRAEAALRTVLNEETGNTTARQLLMQIDELRSAQTRKSSALTLATAQKPVTLEFREAPVRTVFEALSRAANLNFVFDKDVRAESRVTLFLRNTTVDEAMRVILNTQQLGYKLLNENTVLIYPNTAQKQRDLLDTVTRTFYLTNADPKQVQTLVRTVAKSKDIFVDDRLNLLVVRDTPEVMRLVERLVQSVDLPDPEVMLELEVMEVSSTKLNSIGLSWPQLFNYGLPTGTAPITSQTDGLRWSVANPLGVATLKASTGMTNLLANPKIRARNREKAKVLLGEKLPVFTSNLVPGLAGAASTSVNYVDVGLKLELEPQVQLDNDVTIKVGLEVSSVTKEVSSKDGSSLAYQVGTRQASTTLRLKDGETQILAGLINDSESRNASGIPALHDLPLAGRLFGTTTSNHDKTEVVLLITPRIVRNISQPALATSAMASGTEAQPGAPTLTLRPEASAGASGGGGNGGGMRAPVDAGGRGAAPQNNAGLLVTGPEVVMPGGTFQITVRNQGTQAVSTTVGLDSGLLDFIDGGSNGRASVELPPQGSKVLVVRAKPGIASADTEITVDGGESLRLRLRGPEAPQEEQEHDMPLER